MTIRLPNSCFIHVPRTGGLWFGELLHKIQIKHQVLRGDIDSHFRHKDLPDTWKRLEAFSFIRMPLEWLQSRWSHAVEINAKEDERHEGIHRLFDENVKSTFEATVRSILKHRPGLVGLTFQEMQDGVTRIARTEDLPTCAYRLLQDLEGVPVSVWDWLPVLGKTNSTGSSDKYKKLLNLPITIQTELLDSECVHIDRWKKENQYAT